MGLSCAMYTGLSCNTSICSSPWQCLNEDGSGPTAPNDCGTCCCDPSDPIDSCNINDIDLRCEPDKEPCTGPDRGLCCGCSEDVDCEDPAVSIGCGSDACCRSRPSVSSTTPAHNATSVCANTKIKTIFNQEMKVGSFSGNVIVAGEYSGSCPDGTVYVAQKEVKEKYENRNIFVRIYYNIKNKLAYTWHKIAGWFGKDALADPLSSMNYCAVPGNISGHQLGDGKTELIFSPTELLEPERKYFVIVMGDKHLDSATGVKSSWLIGMNASSTSPVNSNSSFNGLSYNNSYIWSFKTIEDQGDNGICEVDHVYIDPYSYLFQTVEDSLQENDSNPDDDTYDKYRDRDKEFVAEARNKDNQPLAPIPGVYNWIWNWDIQYDRVATVSSEPGFTATGSRQLIQAESDVTDDKTEIYAENEITDDLYLGTTGTITTGTSTAHVFLCENPWPYFDGHTWEPWQDENDNCDLAGGTCHDYNFELYYCRDSGKEGTADDLPAIKRDPLIVPSSDSKMKELYFFREEIPDISSAITGLSATTTSGGGGVKIGWDDCPSEAESFRIYYDTSPGEPYDNYEEASTTAVGCPNPSYEITGLTNEQTYYFAVTAVASTGAESVFSEEVSATPHDSEGASAPDITGVSARDGLARLGWSDTSGGDAFSFEIYYTATTTCNSGINFGESITIPYNTQSTSTVPNLANGVEYCLGIAGVDMEGNAGAKNTTSTIPMAGPVNLSLGEITSTSVRLNWDFSDNYGDGVDKNIIYFGQDLNNMTPQATSGAITSATVDGLSSSNSYNFYVRTQNGLDQESAASNLVQATPNDESAPSALNITGISPWDREVMISWEDTSDGDAVRAVLYYKATGTCDSSVNFNSDPISYSYSVYGTSSTSTVSSLNNGDKYCFAMTAVDSEGNESPMTYASPVTMPFAHAHNLATSSVESGTVGLTWGYTDDSGKGVASTTVFVDGNPEKTVDGYLNFAEITGLSSGNHNFRVETRSYLGDTHLSSEELEVTIP